MQANRDFILFDEPGPALPPSQPMLNAAGPAMRAGMSYAPPAPNVQMTSAPISVTNTSFTKHRSPNQSPLMDDANSLHQAGTLDMAGSPQKKRQRGHGYSSSWNGLDSRQLAVLQQVAAHVANNRPPPPGLADSNSPPNLAPPKDPPSGSLGAPMHDLSLGDSISDQSRARNFAPGNYASPGGGMTQEQQERVKAQIRAELAGVDSRAFKGPLRDIMQQSNYTPRLNDQTSPLSVSSDPMQAGVAPSFSLFPDYDVGQSQASNANSKGLGRMYPQRPGQPRRRSSSFDSSYLGSSSFGKTSQGFLADLDQVAAAHWTPYAALTPTDGRQNQALPASEAMPPPTQSQSQWQQQQQMTVNPQNQQAGSRGTMTCESRGLTVSPQQAFLDYDDVESALAHSGMSKTPSLFAPVPPGLADALAGHHSKHDTGSNRTTGASTIKAGLFDVTRSDEKTAVRPDAESKPPVTSFGSHGQHRIPMSRNDTAKQHHYPKRPGHQPYQGEGRGSTSQESGSQSSIFSQTESQETISTDDDEDEDERPYYPPSMRPSMLRGGPSSLYLNFPAKPPTPSSQASNSSFGSNDKRPSFGQEKPGTAGTPWGHVRPEVWTSKQLPGTTPRFSDVSASSSDSDDDRGNRGMRMNSKIMHQIRPQMTQTSSSEDMDVDPESTRVKARQRQSGGSKVSRMMMPGAMGGYGYIPGSQESGLAVPINGKPASASKTVPGADDAASITGSQDDGSVSPSIRSSAQAIDRHQPSPSARPVAAERKKNHTQATRGKVAPPAAGEQLTPDADKMEVSGEEEGDEEEWDDLEESDYEESETATTGSVPRKRRRKSMAPDGKKAVSKNSDAQGPRGSSDSTSPTARTSYRPAAGTTGSTRCDYRSPISGQTCKTAFHRPYDLARHRETIHAREEAGYIREGKLKLEDCIVLGKEVDPKKSMAVVEWKCKTCGYSFSRKDAMLRHERLRHSTAK